MRINRLPAGAEQVKSGQMTVPCRSDYASGLFQQGEASRKEACRLQVRQTPSIY